MKDDTGVCAVFNTQGLSACHMTAATVLDTISCLQGMPGEENVAVSAYTQVIMIHPSRLLMLPETECPNVWIRLPRHCRPKRL